MPWLETDVLEQRVCLVVDALRDDCSMAELCRRYGVSRKTGHKWLNRYRETGSLSGLEDRSRRPVASPGSTPRKLVDRVVELREQYGWGSRALQRLLRQEEIRLGRSTIDRILKREGLLGESTRMRPAPGRFCRSRPMELVQMDFKGEYGLWDQRKCYPLSLLDDHSRYALALEGLASQHTGGVVRVLEKTFERFGVPESMLVDHGTPWWSSTNGHGLTRTSVFLIKQGIHLIYSGIRHPQTQGKVERFHGTLARWFRHHGAPQTLEGFSEALPEFRRIYNEIRPHEELDMETPSCCYRPSSRAYQPNPAPWEYPPGADVRTVADNGCVHVGGRYTFVCHALAGEQVWFDRFEDRALVSYRHMLVREIDLSTGASRTILKPYGPTGH